MNSDGNGLLGVVPVTVSIPSADLGLPIAFRVRRIGSQHVPARVRGVPREFPRAPRVRRYRWQERRFLGWLAAVHSDLDSYNHTLAGPRLAAYDHFALTHDVPFPGRHDDRADADRANRDRRVAVRVIVHVPAELVVTAKRLRESFDALEPFHAGHPVPAWDDQPNRRSVLRGNRPAVHLEGEEGVRVPRLREREGPRERNLVRDLRWPSSIRADGEDFNHLRSQASGLQDGPQGNARPAGRAHSPEPPRLPRRQRLESSTTVSRALERRRQGPCAHRLEVGDVQLQRLLNGTDNLEDLFALRHVWSVEVTPHKEGGFRREVFCKSLERSFGIQRFGREDSHAFSPVSGRTSRVFWLARVDWLASTAVGVVAITVRGLPRDDVGDRKAHLRPGLRRAST